MVKERLTAQASGDFNKFSWYVNGIREGNGKELEFPFSGYDSTELELLLKAEDTHCRDSISREINLDDFPDEWEYPNVFTPNGDGINDCFKIGNAENYGNCFELNIYNRWGVQVFHSTDPTECWKGGDLAADVYYYTLRVGEEDQKGSLTLMR